MPSLPMELKEDSDYVEKAMEKKILKKENFLFEGQIAFTKNKKHNVKGYTNLVYGLLLPTFSSFFNPLNLK